MSEAEAQVLFDEAGVDRLMGELAQALYRRHPQMAGLGLVGIRTGGAHLAARLARRLAALAGAAPPLGIMDITLYRDDWTRLHGRPRLGKTEIGFPVEGRTVVLVDDVLYTGRTVRAALDALIDFGRPLRIELLVLVDRGGRELPIQPDYVGTRLLAAADELIDVRLIEEGHRCDGVERKPR